MNALYVIALVVASGFALWRLGRRTRFFLHRLQLSGYKRLAYRTSLAGPLLDLRARPSHLVGALVLAAAWWMSSLGWLSDFALGFSLSLAWSIAFISSRRYRRDRTKKPLVWTPRMKRLGVACCVMAALLLIVGAQVGRSMDGAESLVAWFAGFWLADLLAPVLISLAAALLAPYEKHVHEGFKTNARAQLAERPDLTTVAITGSYGKTSVKFAVREILAQRFPVLATPGSFNTPMGVSKVINNDLNDDHRLLVLEMGIRHPGDIVELTDIARPDIAVVTSVGVAHLESMGSIEAIAREKLTILDPLGPGGTAVVNADDKRVLDGSLKKRNERPENERFGVLAVSTTSDKGDCWAENIHYGVDGARFEVVLRSGERALVSTPLLGRHNVLNILLAIGVGLAAGMRLRQTVRGADRIEPVPHRLSIRKERGLTILDDAFNSNPVGAANAAEVLGAMPGRRVIVTPGMIELGEQEAVLNQVFGNQIAPNADDVILVGPERTLSIRDGLVEGGFPEERIHSVYTLFEARAWIEQHCRPGDTVLYENDLPDQFTESRA
jgi:UDP-N-acetylmuramoyl-tripeptide--D-alanyl-D-alanine ligase